MDKHILQGHAAVFLANTIFGLGVPVTALLLAQWVTPMGYMLTRCVGAAIIFWIISLFTPKEKVAGRDLVVIIVGGLLGFVISQTLTAWALVYTTPVYYSLIATLTPVATMALSAMVLHEDINGRGMAGLLLGIAGAILLVLNFQLICSDNLLRLVFLWSSSFFPYPYRLVSRFTPDWDVKPKSLCNLYLLPDKRCYLGGMPLPFDTSYVSHLVKHVQ